MDIVIGSSRSPTEKSIGVAAPQGTLTVSTCKDMTGRMFSLPEAERSWSYVGEGNSCCSQFGPMTKIPTQGEEWRKTQAAGCWSHSDTGRHSGHTSAKRNWWFDLAVTNHKQTVVCPWQSDTAVAVASCWAWLTSSRGGKKSEGLARMVSRSCSFLVKLGCNAD